MSDISKALRQLYSPENEAFINALVKRLDTVDISNDQKKKLAAQVISMLGLGRNPLVAAVAEPAIEQVIDHAVARLHAAIEPEASKHQPKAPPATLVPPYGQWNHSSSIPDDATLKAAGFVAGDAIWTSSKGPDANLGNDTWWLVAQQGGVPNMPPDGGQIASVRQIQ